MNYRRPLRAFLWWLLGWLTVGSITGIAIGLTTDTGHVGALFAAVLFSIAGLLYGVVGGFVYAVFLAIIDLRKLRRLSRYLTAAAIGAIAGLFAMIPLRLENMFGDLVAVGVLLGCLSGILCTRLQDS